MASPSSTTHQRPHSPPASHTASQDRQQPDNVVSSPSPAPSWSHTPTTPTLLWLGISLPLVAWDTAYMLLRPHSMPGGWLHAPLWVPYALYGEVDHMYGFKQWHAHNGFAAAQSLMNAVESLMYVAYLWLWYRWGVEVVPGRRRAVAGREGALAVLVGFSAAVMTVSKTVLYWLNEYCSGFDNIGHNDPWRLFWLWIVPNGAWLVAPMIYMIYDMGEEIIAGLAGVSHPAPSRTVGKNETKLKKSL